MRAKPGECFQDSERELCKREPATEDRPAKPEPANQNARHSHGDASSLNGSFLAFSPRIHHRSLCLECGSHTQRCTARPPTSSILRLARGVLQGDPLGAPFFCLVTKEVSKPLKSDFNYWYPDDGTIRGDVHSVTEDFQQVADQSAVLGLEPDMAECEIFVWRKKEQRTTLSLGKAIVRTATPLSSLDLMLLGAPILPAVL
ncbi:hypothetical protein RvY_02900-1 [Ramazzottius varieornatus]|uniref:Reverse transcriptase domain-containing protein n=1 Tax=Ramazzottius varieornatus TaxID=947166 RepID=A0A1D1UVU1_RAMVA|nr:hypothetical protein RvY_02900-1 [Ramazzottius varieornatus]